MGKLNTPICVRAALHHLRCLAAAICFVLCGSSSSAAVLYSTDFSAFPVGDDKLVGYEGWQGNSIGYGVHGVESNLVQGLGKSGWLGYGLPNTNLVKVFRSISSVAAPEKVTWSGLIGITPSLVGSDDIFNISFSNTGEVFLAALKFDTTLNNFGIWRDNGVARTFTGQYFGLEELHFVRIEIDFRQNLWSAYLDDAIIFQNAQFTAKTVPRNAGYFAFEWQITNMSDSGDNWILFDNINVTAPDIRITSIRPQPGGSRRLEWIAAKAGTNQVQISSNLVSWTDLPGARVQASQSGAVLSYTDLTATNVSRRCYRIQQQ